MPENIVYFDLETQRSANDVGGWGHKDKMGMSVGVTYSTEPGKYVVFGESRVDDLVDQLAKADLVIGYNHISFDYEVLMGYTILDLKEQIRSFDLMTDLEEKLGHRLKLDSVASASLGTGKTAEGLQAIRWWQQYKKSGDPAPLMSIAQYCCFDVKVTKMVHEYGHQHGHVKYLDRFGREQTV
ncbi:MAG: ribonuclease H-like domain-containing protein, partial [Verrucomicrobiales bacterium]